MEPLLTVAAALCGAAVLAAWRLLRLRQRARAQFFVRAGSPAGGLLEEGREPRLAAASTPAAAPLKSTSAKVRRRGAGPLRGGAEQAHGVRGPPAASAASSVERRSQTARRLPCSLRFPQLVPAPAEPKAQPKAQPASEEQSQEQQLPSAEAARLRHLRSIVASYGLPYAELSALLQEHRSLAAGGAMLAAYMGTCAQEFSGDLDLFVRPVSE